MIFREDRENFCTEVQNTPAVFVLCESVSLEHEQANARGDHTDLDVLLNISWSHAMSVVNLLL